MAFKQKPCKIKLTQELKTLDEIHTETLKNYDEINDKIKNLKKKIKLLENKLKKYLEKNNLNNNEMINDINGKINNLNNEILLLENSNDELEYFAKTKDILIQYYENKSKDSDDKIPDEIEISTETDNLQSENMTNTITDTDGDKDKLLDRFDRLTEKSKRDLKIKSQAKKRRVQQKPDKISILSLLALDNSGNKSDQPIQHIVHEKGTLKDQYLCLTDSAYVSSKLKSSNIKLCKKCNCEPILMQSEGYLICPNCSEAEYVIIESEIPSHKDALNEKPKYPYNPINHLIEKLNQYQAKQTTVIKPKIYDIIKAELKKRIIDIDDVTPELIQDILKKYKKNMYYEHHYLIFSHITNTPPPSITRDEEDDIKKMFRMTEKPFKIFKPDWRDNNLNYSYVLNKLFLIKAELDNNQKMAINARYFKLLKSRDKLKMQDIIWKSICKYNNWPFHSSF
jgi:hypothetical protein